MTTLVLDSNSKAAILKSAWMIAKAAQLKNEVGTVREYFSESLKLAWKRFRSGSTMMLKAIELNANATKLHSDNSRVYLGASVSLKRTSLVVADEGLKRASMMFGNRRKWLNAWVRDDKYPTRTEEYRAELEYLNREDVSIKFINISEKQYIWLTKIFYNQTMAMYKDSIKTVQYNISKEGDTFMLTKSTK